MSTTGHLRQLGLNFYQPLLSSQIFHTFSYGSKLTLISGWKYRLLPSCEWRVILELKKEFLVVLDIDKKDFLFLKKTLFGFREGIEFIM